MLFLGVLHHSFAVRELNLIMESCIHRLSATLSCYHDGIMYDVIDAFSTVGIYSSFSPRVSVSDFPTYVCQAHQILLPIPSYWLKCTPTCSVAMLRCPFELRVFVAVDERPEGVMSDGILSPMQRKTTNKEAWRPKCAAPRLGYE